MISLDEDKIKWGVVVILSIIAIYLIYVSLVSGFDISKKLREGQREISYAEGLEKLSSSPSVCIVEMLDGVNEKRRQNIMNCGVNLASTLPLYGKKLSVYVIEGGNCYYTEGTKSIEECYREIEERGCFVVEVNGKNQVESYENLFVIPVGDEFDNEKDCKVEG